MAYKPPALPTAPKEYDAEYLNRTLRVLTQHLNLQAGSTQATAAADINNSEAKTALVAADEIGFWDSVTQRLNKITWANTLVTLNGTYNRKNLVINGAFDIAQRNTTYALTTGFAYGCVDRWVFSQATTPACTASQVAIATSGIPFRYGLKLQRTASATTTGQIIAATVFETTDSVKFAGKQVTLSFYAKAGANYSAAGSILNCIVYTGTGTDQSSTTIGSWTGVATPLVLVQAITTTMTRYTVTGTIAANATQIAIVPDWTPVGTAGADDSVTITGVQLEVGASATDFEFRSIAEELALCQRYFANVGDIFSGISEGTNYIVISGKFPVAMRVLPTGVGRPGTYCSFRYAGTDSSIANPSLSYFSASVDGYWVWIGGISGLTPNYPIISRVPSGAIAKCIAVDAEL